MGHGQITPAAADYITTPKWGDGVVEQDFAELLLRGELSDGWGAGTVVARHGPHLSRPVVQRWLLPRRDRRARAAFQRDETSAFAASRSTLVHGSPNLHQFSTVSAISGGYDVWEVFGELNVPIWQSSSGERNLGTSFAYRSSDYSSVGRFDSLEGRDSTSNFFRDLRLRATRSRDVREATFTERFDLSPGGGSVLDPARNDAQSTVTITDGRQSGPASRSGRHDRLRSRLSAELGRGPAHVGRPLRGRHLRLDRDARRAARRRRVLPAVASSASTCFATISAC